MKASFISLFSALLSINAFAQAPQQSVLSSTQTALAKATSDYNEASAEIKRQIADPTHYEPCKVELAKIEKDYADWYVKHASQFEALVKPFDELIAFTNKKITDLRSTTIQLVPVKEQQPGQEKITFQKVLDYFADLNLRAQASQKAGQYETFKRQMNDADLNPFNVSNDQIISALASMTTIMNGSLRERGVTLELESVPVEVGFDLRLKVTLDLNPKQPVEISLLSKNHPQVSMSEADRWALVKDSEINGMPVDGQLRFAKMIGARMSECIHEFPKYSAAQAPYVSYSEIKYGGVVPSQYLVQHAVCTVYRDYNRNDVLGIISFEKGMALIQTWGGTSNAWAATPVQLNGETIQVMWTGAYGQIDFVPSNTPFVYFRGSEKVVCHL